LFIFSTLYIIQSQNSELVQNFLEKDLSRYQTGTIIQDLVKKMELEEFMSQKSYTLISGTINSNSYFPSIHRIDTRFILILPINFFSLPAKQKESLLAHEFGHIKADDVRLWLFLHKIAIVFKFAYLPLIFWKFFTIFLVADEYSFPAFFLIFFGSIIYSIYLWKLIDRIQNHRMQSEYLADICAIIYSDGNALIECLNNYHTKTRTKSKTLHFPLESRISEIKYAMRNYTSVPRVI